MTQETQETRFERRRCACFVGHLGDSEETLHERYTRRTRRTRHIGLTTRDAHLAQSGNAHGEQQGDEDSEHPRGEGWDAICHGDCLRRGSSKTIRVRDADPNLIHTRGDELMRNRVAGSYR